MGCKAWDRADQCVEESVLLGCVGNVTLILRVLLSRAGDVAAGLGRRGHCNAKTGRRRADGTPECTVNADLSIDCTATARRGRKHECRRGAHGPVGEAPMRVGYALVRCGRFRVTLKEIYEHVTRPGES